MVDRLIKIVSRGGFVDAEGGTRVYNHDGTEIHNVGRIEIDPLVPKGFVKVRIELLAELGGDFKEEERR